MPTISMDYQEFDIVAEEGQQEEDTARLNVKTIVIKDEPTMTVSSYTVRQKGPGDNWVVKKIAKDMSERGRTKVILKSDGEPAMIAMQEATQKAREGQQIILNNPPAYNPEPNGACEKAVQDVNGHTRCLKLGLESRIKSSIGDSDAIMEWIIPHSAHLISKYSVGHDGMTPYERLTGKKWRRPICEIGDIVLAKLTLMRTYKGTIKTTETTTCKTSR